MFDKKARKALIISIILHLLLASLLWVEINFPLKSPPIVNKKLTQQPIIHAETLDPVQLKKQLQQIVAQKKLKEKKQHLLEKRAKLAEIKTKRELEKLQATKAEILQLNKAQEEKKQAAEKHLADLKQKAIDEEKRVEQLTVMNIAEKKKLEATKKLQEEAEKKKALEALKKKELESLAIKQRQLKNARETTLLHYQSLIIEEIGHHWIVSSGINPDLSCKLEISLANDGRVLSVKIIRSSGNQVLDRSAQMAVYKASPLPVPNDADLFEPFKHFNLTVRPENVIRAS